MRARKRFGQHYLTDQGVLDRIVSVVALREKDSALEIGPGQGALTQYLTDVPCRYVGIEIDRDLIPMLERRFSTAQFINQDILNTDFLALFGETKGWRVIGNLPYNISSPLIMALCNIVRKDVDAIGDCHFMLQKEMAQRLAANPGSKAWGRLSIMAQIVFNIEMLFSVSPDSFKPPPKVWSTVLRLTPIIEDRLKVDVPRLDRVLKMAFSARRKRLANALKPLNIDWQATDIDPDVRADNVTIDQFVLLSKIAGEVVSEKH